MAKHYDKQFKLDAIRYYHDHRELGLQGCASNLCDAQDALDVLKKAKIKDIYDKSKQNYGAPKITQVLRKTGETISERTVGQYMKQMGIKAQWVKPWIITTKDSDFSSKLQNILDE